MASASVTSPVILDSSPNIEVSGHFGQYDDPSGRLTLSDMLEPARAARFRHIDGDLNDGYSHKAVWLHFTLQRSARFPDRQWLRLYPHYLDFVTAYIQTGSDPTRASSYEQFRLGDHIPVSERPVLDLDYLLPLALPAGEPVNVYVRIRSISSLTFAAAVHTPKDMYRQTSTNVLFQGGYLAIAMVITLMNFIFYLRIGDRLFLYFSLYAAAVFTNYLAISGVLSLILPGAAHLVSDYLADIGKGGGILIVSVFLKRLFAAELAPFTRRYLELMAVIGALTVLADPLGFYIEMAPLAAIGSLGLFIVVNWLSYKAVRNRQPGSISFFAAFAVSNLGYFLHFMKLLGWVPIDWWNINNIQLASLLNMVLMSFALTERLRETERQAMAALRESELRSVEFETQRVATERQKHFLAMLSHEYRTPLAIISSALDIMELQKVGRYPEGGVELDKMKRAVRRMVEVMEVSLEKSRLSDSLEKEGRKGILVEPFMESEIAEVRTLWPNRIFTFSGLNTAYAIMVEERYFKIAIFNMLDNARKYSPPDTPVEVECCKEGGEVVIRIRNQSAAILPDNKQELFEKYRRGSNSSNTSGSGLGLWLAREIIGRYRGRVSIESSGFSVILTLHLPLAASNQEYIA